MTEIRHGSHVTEDNSAPAAERAAKREDLTRLQDAVAGSAVVTEAGGGSAALAEPEEVLALRRYDPERLFLS